MELDTTITLIGVRLAKIGTEFIYKGPASECEECRFKNSCMNLLNGRKYRIVNIRTTTTHNCQVHDGGVQAVEVVESPTISAIESKKAFEGSKIVFEPLSCNKNECGMYDLCHPIGLEFGDKCTITTIIGNAPDDCIKGLSLKLVELKHA
ncbi:MAG: UPF0179 family protein [Euryarchaeota archaeon]|nr:UPF0179 family protein [Euryarchaeota archaeon]